MSRAQQGAIVGTAGKENQNYNTNANTSFNTAQGDIDTYGQAVGKFNAANPYVQGGAVQTAENQQASDTAAGGAQALGETLQGAAVRGGQNPNAAIAATEKVAEANDRTLAGQEAADTVGRAGASTAYQEAGLGMQAGQTGMETKLAEDQGQLAQGALGTEEKAAETPSFLDELGQGLIQSGTQFGGRFAQGYGQGAGAAAGMP